MSLLKFSVRVFRCRRSANRYDCRKRLVDVNAIITAAAVFVAASPLFPIRVLAGLALIAVIAVFVHVLRHLRTIERTIKADNLIPAQRGPRNNILFILCAVPIIIVSVLFFLLIKA